MNTYRDPVVSPHIQKISNKRQRRGSAQEHVGTTSTASKGSRPQQQQTRINTAIIMLDNDDEGAVSFVRQGGNMGDREPTVLRQQRARIAVLAIGALSVILVTVDATTTRFLEQAVNSFVEWLALHPVAGVGAVILVYIVATVCFVPGSLITVGVGFAFGRAFDSVVVAVALASTAVFVGASLGSLCCLLLGRYLFREPVLRLANHYPIFRAIDRALEGNGFKIMLLLRLSPLIPYNALDYISGITSISVQHYSLALMGLLPGAVVMCYIGATASSLADGADAASENKTLRSAVLILGLVFAFAGAAVASYYSKIELDKILSRQQQQESDGENVGSLETSEGLVLTRSASAGTDQFPTSSVFTFGNTYHDIVRRTDDDQHELT